MEHGIGFCHSFFPWYNTEHRHSGLAMLTPEDVHYGRAPAVLDQRRNVLAAAFKRNPERFVGGQPAPQKLSGAVWVNPPPEEKDPLPVGQ